MSRFQALNIEKSYWTPIIAALADRAMLKWSIQIDFPAGEIWLEMVHPADMQNKAEKRSQCNLNRLERSETVIRNEIKKQIVAHLVGK